MIAEGLTIAGFTAESKLGKVHGILVLLFMQPTLLQQLQIQGHRLGHTLTEHLLDVVTTRRRHDQLLIGAGPHSQRGIVVEKTLYMPPDVLDILLVSLDVRHGTRDHRVDHAHINTVRYILVGAQRRGLDRQQLAKGFGTLLQPLPGVEGAARSHQVVSHSMSRQIRIKEEVGTGACLEFITVYCQKELVTVFFSLATTLLIVGIQLLFGATLLGSLLQRRTTRQELLLASTPVDVLVNWICRCQKTTPPARPGSTVHVNILVAVAGVVAP